MMLYGGLVPDHLTNIKSAFADESPLRWTPKITFGSCGDDTYGLFDSFRQRDVKQRTKKHWKYLRQIMSDSQRYSLRRISGDFSRADARFAFSSPNESRSSDSNIGVSSRHSSTEQKFNMRGKK